MDSVNHQTALRGYDHPHVIDDRVTIPHNWDRGRELRPCPACDAVVALQDVKPNLVVSLRCGMVYVHEEHCALPHGPCDCRVRRLTNPLAGHAGDCAKVTTATVTGKTDAACSCGVNA